MVTDVMTAILAVFSGIGDWFVEFLPTLYALFWDAETGLTFLGVTAIMSLGIATIFLLVRVVQNFLHFRG